MHMHFYMRGKVANTIRLDKIYPGDKIELVKDERIIV